MNVAMFSALSAWVGGVISWFIAAAFDYSARETALKNQIGLLEIELKYAPSKATTYSIDLTLKATDPKKYDQSIRDAAANQLTGMPAFWDSLQETYTQPLFVSSLTGGIAFFGAPQNREIGLPLLLWITATAGTIVIAILNGKDFGVTRTIRHGWFILGSWLIVLGVFVGAAFGASHVDAKNEKPSIELPKGDHPDGG